ncbi:MAG: glycerol-3-phosphate dehydrogenase, partial [Promicromonosporaceae bacterium]|nr:glycerol-3-phosphate dehydrogenase [Promicromonosporaceae bacterium]
MMVDHLLHRYGSDLTELIVAINADPSLAEPLANAPAYLRAEIAHAVTHEGAIHLEDVLVHRTRLDYETPDHGLSAMDEIAEIVAPLLGWDAARVATEKDSYRARVAAYQAAITRDTEDGAAAARAEAPEITPMAELAVVVDD